MVMLICGFVDEAIETKTAPPSIDELHAVAESDTIETTGFVEVEANTTAKAPPLPRVTRQALNVADVDVNESDVEVLPN